MAFGVSQPIQMRTNELIAGIRSDAAAQIYGPDLESCGWRDSRIGGRCGGIPGVADLRVEQGAGLTYLRIRPDRARLARYGLTVEDVNTVTETMAVGRTVGQVFEKDRRFDHGGPERARLSGQPGRRASAAAQVGARPDRPARRRRGRGARDWPGAGQPRQAVPSPPGRVQRRAIAT